MKQCGSRGRTQIEYGNIPNSTLYAHSLKYTPDFEDLL